MSKARKTFDKRRKGLKELKEWTAARFHEMQEHYLLVNDWEFDLCDQEFEFRRRRKMQDFYIKLRLMSHDELKMKLGEMESEYDYYGEDAFFGVVPVCSNNEQIKVVEMMIQEKEKIKQ